MLYIILLLVVAVVGWSYIDKAKARVRRVNQAKALKKLSVMEKEGTLYQVPYPSWMTNRSQLENFAAIVQGATDRAGVPNSFFIEMFSNINDRTRLMLLAGMMEKNNSSFNEQSRSVADTIIGCWSRRSMHS